MVIAKLLIAIGATIDAKNNNAFTPSLILADINATTNDGRTALHLASKKGHLDVCKYFVSKGCDVNAIDDRTFTSFHDASFDGHFEVTEDLIAKGAKIDAKDIDGFTPLSNAAQEGHLKLVKFLHWASKNGHLDICK